MLFATVVRIDDSILIEDVEIQAQDARRGTGDGHIWRGVFDLPGARPGLTMGETIHLRLEDRSLIAAVVTEVEGNRIHFRARGKKPTESPPVLQ
ncbi:hypothetical protein Pan44_19840 [Caulifigura coniformis]|uniref:Uncharacterized protein n=1 Tax=Caulifigura coniformis TaxID=2527983 RepID=A0A517SCV7_9PLAN|nr:hypothetical protein [Caulifigura coniformis]QDT53957.1 hypothetical protein Pan44_19840 [Caulifigura coniformis]